MDNILILKFPFKIELDINVYMSDSNGEYIFFSDQPIVLIKTQQGLRGGINRRINNLYKKYPTANRIEVDVHYINNTGETK
jgi:hypothetical protein